VKGSSTSLFYGVLYINRARFEFEERKIESLRLASSRTLFPFRVLVFIGIYLILRVGSAKEIGPTVHGAREWCDFMVVFCKRIIMLMGYLYVDIS
jgi:hypothetical protein